MQIPATHNQGVAPEAVPQTVKLRSELIPWWLHFVQIVAILHTLNYAPKPDPDNPVGPIWLLSSLWLIIGCILVWSRWKYAVNTSIIPAICQLGLVAVSFYKGILDGDGFLIGYGIVFTFIFLLYIFWLFQVRKPWLLSARNAKSALKLNALKARQAAHTPDSDEDSVLLGAAFETEKPRSELLPQGIVLLQYVLLVSFVVMELGMMYIASFLATINIQTARPDELFVLGYAIALVFLIPLVVAGLILMLRFHRMAVSLLFVPLCILEAFWVAGVVIAMLRNHTAGTILYLVLGVLTGVYGVYVWKVKDKWDPQV